MSLSCIQCVLFWCRKLDLWHDESRVVPSHRIGPPHGIVPPHGIAFPQWVLMGQLAFLKCLNEDGRLLIQFSGTAPRSGHFCCVAKLGVVHWIHTFFLWNNGHEAVTPQDFLWDIGGPGLSSDPSCLYNTFQDDDYLQILARKIRCWDVIEGASLVYDVADNQWGH